MNDEERIRQLAYSIWEAEGRPEGQQQHHWERARKIVAAEHSADSEEELVELQELEMLQEVDELQELGEPLDEPPIFEEDLPLEEDEMGIQENRLPLDDPNDDALLDDDALHTDASLQGDTLVEQDAAEVPSKKTATAPTKRKPASTPKSEAKVVKKAAPRAKRAKSTKSSDRS
ncbi:hypothetical protein LCGC14_0037670 [marine sediment metagenome]|uniref:DUF2934 domain-containing protein n=1 Tax=marine sediment metagenome TaxID=412755 RepID=A0A0F9VZB6_9ZZZZ|nr:DUF2934 domain-containing protein [Halomonas sp.]HDZ48618.1 DUF2934 domain-containing protein [Halomonas sp.]HEB04616.1 DUF2934 domain-containing protein [Halomonas sp.]